MTFHLPVLTFLYADPHYVPHRLYMSLHDPVISCKSRGSYGAHVLDHLAADGASLTGGQVAIVAILQIDPNFPWCVFTTKTQFYFEVNTHQGGLMFLTS